MGQPTPYTPTTDFSNEEASGVAGRSTVRTAAVDVEFDNLATTIGQILTNLAIIQRDDGGIRDLKVEPYTLSAATLALIGSAGFTLSSPLGWLTATVYAARAMVTNGTGTYVCAVAHTSGTFATDLAAGKWATLFDSSAYVASGVAFTPTGTISATNVQAAIAEAALEAAQKASNLSDLANAATARTNLGLGSGNSPTFTGLTTTAAVTEQKRASTYVYTAWDPIDVVGTQTNAPATASATSTAADYITVANSLGTTTWTCVKAGKYRFTANCYNEGAAASTYMAMRIALGGTATRLLGFTTEACPFSSAGSPGNPEGGTITFDAEMTAGQTVTTLPKIAVVSGGVTTNFTNQCSITAEYVGAT